MKKTLFAQLAVGLFLLLGATLGHAQTPAQQQPALPGYWNIETNLVTRDYTIVRFYNGQDQLVYEERLPGLCLDLSKRARLCQRTSRQLTVALQQVLHDAAARESATLLAQQFGANRRMQRVYATR